VPGGWWARRARITTTSFINTAAPHRPKPWLGATPGRQVPIRSARGGYYRRRGRTGQPAVKQGIASHQQRPQGFFSWGSAGVRPGNPESGEQSERWQSACCQMEMKAALEGMLAEFQVGDPAENLRSTWGHGIYRASVSGNVMLLAPRN